MLPAGSARLAGLKNQVGGGNIDLDLLGLGQHRYREDAALWAFREANRLSMINWERGRKLIEPAVAELENKALTELPGLEERVKIMVKEGRNEEARKVVTEYSNAFAYGAMNRWQELKRELWQMFGRGF